MARRKIEKIMEAQTFPNVFQPEDVFIKGNWRKDYFNNKYPITLELGCGTGALTIAFAKQFPKQNVIGIDIKGARIWNGAKIAIAEGLHNVAFLRIPIETITNYFSAKEVNEIWITFPDPFPKPTKARHRLTAKRFLDLYKKILIKGGRIHLKTDSELLFQSTQETLKDMHGKPDIVIDDLYQTPITDPLLTIQTVYEKRHLRAGRRISYLAFSLPTAAPA